MEDKNDDNALAVVKTQHSPPSVKRTVLAPAAFSVSARVAMQLGRESISISNTAIIELVKNAYDADAEAVRIRFMDLGTPNARMALEDDGHGMTESELRSNWLFIGTNNKQQSVTTLKKKRVQTGEKGLGRLGLDRLCRRVVVQSMRERDDDDKSSEMFPDVSRSAVELDVVWDRYQEAAGNRLETIQHVMSTLDHLDFDPLTLEPRPFPHGTRLVLDGLKDEWTRERLNELADELSLLLSPFGRPEDFSIHIDSGLALADVDGPVNPPASLLQLATLKVEAKIESVKIKDQFGREAADDERVSIRMTSPYHERAFLPPTVLWSEFVKHKRTESEKGTKISECGPLKFEFHVFIRDAEELAKKGSGLGEVGSFLAANRGIRIYRDGFRVKPFGDPAGQYDWLTLSLRRASNPAAISRDNWKVAYHQVVGAVFVSRSENPKLIDQTNREGLVEGKAFDDMRLFAEKVIQYFEGRAHQDEVTQNPRVTKSIPPQDAGDKAAAALEEIDVAIRTLKVSPENVLPTQPTNLIEAAVPKAKAALERMQVEKEEMRKQFEEEVAELRDEMVIMTSLASLGIMTASFGHERVNDATEVLNDAARLRKHIANPQTGLFSCEERLAMLDHLIAGAERVDAFAKFALDHVRPRKRQKQSVALRGVVERALKTFDELLCDRYGVKVAAIIPDGDEFWVPGWEAGWESVLVNFITNSCWALSKRHIDERRIEVSLGALGADVLLLFEDSGVGLEAGTELDIFRPGITTKRDEHNRLIGTGMGLTIVNSFVVRNAGSIRAVAISALGGARFEIRVPRAIYPAE